MRSGDRVSLDVRAGEVSLMVVSASGDVGIATMSIDEAISLRLWMEGAVHHGRMYWSRRLDRWVCEEGMSDG